MWLSPLIAARAKPGAGTWNAKLSRARWAFAQKAFEAGRYITRKTLRRVTTGVGMGAPRRAEDANPEQRFSGLRSRFRSECPPRPICCGCSQDQRDYRVTFWKYGGRSFLVSLRISTMAWRSASDSAARYRGSCASPDNTSHNRL